MLNNSNYNCTFLLSTCDAYADALNPFFILFKKYFSNCPYDIAINTEHNSFKFNDINISVYNLEKNDNNSWSYRLKECLKRINTKYIILFLEDMFIIDYVDVNMLNRFISYLEQDSSIASITLYHYSPERYIQKENRKYKDLIQRGKVAFYLLSCGGNIWRKEALINFLGENENPWEFEEKANIRAVLDLNYKFYTLTNNIKKPIPFMFEERKWSPICHGKWVLSEIDNIFKKHNIIVNYNKMGILDESRLNKIKTIAELEYQRKNKWIFKLKLNIILKPIVIIRNFIRILLNCYKYIDKNHPLYNYDPVK